MNQFEKFLSIVKKKPPEKHVVDISHHKFQKKSNIVDISHHKEKQKPVVKESHDEDDFDDINFTYDHEQYGDTGHEEHMEQTHARNLEGKHIDAVHGYVHGGLEHGYETGSYEINRYLLKQHQKGSPVPENKTFSYKNEDGDEISKVNLTHLDDAIKQNRHAHGLVTYSGIQFDPSKHINENKELHMPAYTSSSTRMGIAKGYTKNVNGERHILRIHHPQDTTGLYIGNNEDMSGFGQNEHMSPRNMKIRIMSTPTKNREGYTIWNAERITP